MEKKETNRSVAANNKLFKLACESAGIKPTKRQASKFRMGKGLAYKASKSIKASN